MENKSGRLYDIPVYPASSKISYTPVDTWATIFLAVEAPNWPLTGVLHALLEGNCDMELLQACMLDATARRPVFTSHLAAMGPPTAQRLIWRHQPVSPTVEIDNSAGTTAGPRGIDEFTRAMARADQLWEPDLTVEPPISLHLSKKADDLTLLTIKVHHSMGDASTHGAFIRDVLASYQMKVTGTAPGWANETTLHSVATAAAPPVASWRRFFAVASESRTTYPIKEMAHISGTAGTPRPLISSSCITDEEQIESLRKRCRAVGASMTDLLIASSMVAIAEWNEEQGEPARVQRHGIAVNTRGRTPEASLDEGGNQLSQIIVGATPTDIANPEQLLLHIADQRRSMLDEGIDVLNLRWVRGWLKAMSVVPIRQRLPLVNASSAADQTLLVTNAGIYRPEMAGGKPTGAAIQWDLGDLREGALTGWSNTPPTNPNALMVARYHNGLITTLGGNQARTTQDELERVHELMIERLLSFID